MQRPSKPPIPVDTSCSLRPPLPTHCLHPKLPLAPPATLLPTLKAPTSQESPLCSTSLSPLHLALTDSCPFQTMPCPQQPLQGVGFYSPLLCGTLAAVEQGIACPVLGILRVVTHFTLSTAPFCRQANWVLRGESPFVPFAAWSRFYSSPSANTLLH